MLFQSTNEIYTIQNEILTHVSSDKTDYYYVARSFEPDGITINKNTLYQKHLNAGGNWTVGPVEIPGLDPGHPYSVIGSNRNGKKLYILNSFRGDNLTKSNIYYTTLTSNGWSPLYKVDIAGINFFDPVFSGMVSHDENVMFLSLDDPRVLGQENLYVSFAKGGNKWSWPEQIQGINSVASDFSPFLSDDGKYLYFASNREGGLGNSDIYVSERQDQTYRNWSAPKNMGMEINTMADETYYTELSNDQFFVVQGQDKPDDQFYNTVVLAVNGPEEESILVEKTGDYEGELPTVNDTEAVLTSASNAPMQSSYSGSNSSALNGYNVRSEIGRRYYQQVTGSETVYFGLNSATLSTDGKMVLNQVASDFINNPSMNIEVTGFTCDLGQAGYNMDLSYERAMAVAEHLVYLGVNPAQIFSKGVGENQSAGNQSTNRRAELNYLEMSN